MGRPKTIDDDEILRHAAAIFREGGHTASTRDVARAAGISQAVLYQRFGSKENLFLRAMTPRAPNLETLLGRYPARDVRGDLVRMGVRLADYLASLLPTLLHVVAHPRLDHEGFMNWHRGLPFEPLLDALTERFRRLRDDGHVGRIDTAAAARVFLASMHSAAIQETIRGHASPDARRALVESSVAVLWRGLAPTTAPKRTSTRVSQASAGSSRQRKSRTR